MNKIIFAIALCTLKIYASELDDPRAPTIPQLAEATWAYSGPLGTHSWRLFPGDEKCGEGQSQSPIAIEPGWEGTFNNTHTHYPAPGIYPKWDPAPLQLVNNGHTIQVLHDPGSYVEVDGTRYALAQFHFHSPSEHTINERQYPMEIHFVHQSSDPAHPKTVVVAVMVQKGLFNPELEKVWQNAPSKVDPARVVNIAHQTIRPGALLPFNLSYFRYEGSLTTPPCSEGVSWIVYDAPIQASAAQLKVLQQLMKGPTNRPIQALNHRSVEAAYFRS